MLSTGALDRVPARARRASALKAPRVPAGPGGHKLWSWSVAKAVMSPGPFTRSANALGPVVNTANVYVPSGSPVGQDRGQVVAHAAAPLCG